MSDVAKISRIRTKKRPLGLVRSLVEILQSGQFGSQVYTGMREWVVRNRQWVQTMAL